MKRFRRKQHLPDNNLKLFDTEEPKTEVKRQRKTDDFIERNIGKDALTVLEEFLIERKKYILKDYPENQQIVLFEWDLYYSVLQRIKKGINSKKLKNGN